ncbi:hypothetical protein MHYP_G00333690 [Metynnis hypsauchen]
MDFSGALRWRQSLMDGAPAHNIYQVAIFPPLLQDNELFFFTAGVHFFSARSRKRVILFLSHGLKISITTQKWRQSRCSLWACCVIKIDSRKHELERWKTQMLC